MDDEQLHRLLADIVDEDAPPATATVGRTLFALRSRTDELAELAAEDDHPRPDDPAGDAWPDRTLVFAGPVQAVAVALDGARHRAAGQLDPPRAAAASLRHPAGEPLPVGIDAQGRFTIDPLPPGPLQLVIDAAPTGEPGSTRTTWHDWLDQPAAAPGTDGTGTATGGTATAGADAGTGPAGPAGTGLGDLVVRLLARRATEAIDALRRPAATVTSLPGSFDPPVATVSRTLAAAAQQGARRLPAHRWAGADGHLSVVLAETPDGLLTLTVIGDAELPADSVVAVTWATTTADDSPRTGHLVTPLPPEAAEERRAAYEVGSALELRSFHLLAVELVPVAEVTPATVEASLAHRAYGNAIRAWTELLDHHPDPALRAAFDRALGQL